MDTFLLNGLADMDDHAKLLLTSLTRGVLWELAQKAKNTKDVSRKESSLWPYAPVDVIYATMLLKQRTTSFFHCAFTWKFWTKNMALLDGPWFFLEMRLLQECQNSIVKERKKPKSIHASFQRVI